MLSLPLKIRFFSACQLHDIHQDHLHACGTSRKRAQVEHGVPARREWHLQSKGHGGFREGNVTSVSSMSECVEWGANRCRVFASHLRRAAWHGPCGQTHAYARVRVFVCRHASKQTRACTLAHKHKHTIYQREAFLGLWMGSWHLRLMYLHPLLLLLLLFNHPPSVGIGQDARTAPDTG